MPGLYAGRALTLNVLVPGSAGRYPANTTFNVTKEYSYTLSNSILRPATSLNQMLNNFHGEQYFWDGKLLVSACTTWLHAR